MADLRALGVATCLVFAAAAVAQPPQNADPFGQSGGAADPFAGKAGSPNQPNGHPVQKAEVVVKGCDNSAKVEQGIREALCSRSSVSFVEIPLYEAVASLSKQFNVPMLVDARALEEIGLSTEEPISLTLRNVSLRSILNLLLKELEMTYTIDNEVLVITTAEGAEQNLSTRAYRLPESVISNEKQFLSTLQTCVQPHTWDVLGGPSTASLIGTVLVVSSTEEVHNGIIDLIRKVESPETVNP